MVTNLVSTSEGYVVGTRPRSAPTEERADLAERNVLLEAKAERHAACTFGPSDTCATRAGQARSPRVAKILWTSTTRAVWPTGYGRLMPMMP
jgi:hypothetical protein